MRNSDETYMRRFEIERMVQRLQYSLPEELSPGRCGSDSSSVSSSGSSSGSGSDSGSGSNFRSSDGLSNDCTGSHEDNRSGRCGADISGNYTDNTVEDAFDITTKNLITMISRELMIELTNDT